MTGAKDIQLSVFEEVYTTAHWMVRLYRVRSRNRGRSSKSKNKNKGGKGKRV